MDKLGGDLEEVYYTERYTAGGFSMVEFSNTLHERSAFWFFLNGRKKAILPALN